MQVRGIALAVVLATSAFSANAALTTYAPWDAALSGNGLSGVKFNVASANGVTIALGAHAYKNGVFLPNNGIDTFSAQPGLFEANRANWSFDFAWDLGGCAGCSVKLSVDTDPTAGVNLVTLFDTTVAGTIQALFGQNATVVPDDYFQSWNMEMTFMAPALGYDFNPNGASSTAFRLEVMQAPGITSAAPLRSDITVNVPEPGSLALVGLALAGAAGLRRRKA